MSAELGLSAEEVHVVYGVIAFEQVSNACQDAVGLKTVTWKSPGVWAVGRMSAESK